MQGHETVLLLLIIVLLFKLSKQIIQSSGPRSWPWLESSTQAHRHQDAHVEPTTRCWVSYPLRVSKRTRTSPGLLSVICTPQSVSTHDTVSITTLTLTTIFRVLAAWANGRSNLSACWFCGMWILLRRLWGFTREYHFAACLVWESACGTGGGSTSFRFPKPYYEIYDIYAPWENGFATKWENGFLLPVQRGREVVAMGEWVRDNVGECRSTSSLSTHTLIRTFTGRWYGDLSTGTCQERKSFEIKVLGTDSCPIFFSIFAFLFC